MAGALSRWTILVVVASLASLGGAVTGAGAKRARMAARPAVRFGIYPGGGAGTIGPGLTPAPDDPAKDLAALERLRGGKAFVLHLYASYTGPRGASAADQVGDEVRRYTNAGFEVELVACYRPADGGARTDPAGFAGFVGQAVSSLGRNRRVVSLQVTNEANVDGAADATDGSFARAEDALIAGAVAAHREAHALRLGQLRVGFNWAYATDRGETSFWRYLKRRGGRRFDRAVDWVGLDVYPGTWGPRIGSGRLGSSAAAMIARALRGLRLRYMPLAGLPRRVALHISENGYPTGPARTAAMQETEMRAAIGAVERLRSRYGITDYRWFDLRDARSGAPSFEDRYGLLYDNYAPKPAFGLYRRLVARYGRR
jgi:hypothetical protein